MLQTIRDRSTGWVSIFLFVIITLAFALWGVGNYDFTGSNIIAKVNGEEIPTEDIRRVYRAQMQQYQQFYDEVPAELQEQVRNNVLEGLVRDEVLSQHTRENGYRIGDASLVNAIQDMPMFQDQGSFSPDLFRARLAAQGLSPQYFEEQMRRSLRVTQLQQALRSTAFVTPQELAQRTRLEREQRRADWAQVSATEMANQVEVSEADIEQYYNDNEDSFMSAEAVDLEYVLIDADAIAAGIEVSEDEVREFYEREREAGRFVAPEERRARHILVTVDDDTSDADARNLATELLGRIQSGEDFATLASEFSDDPGSAPDGGDLGWAGRDVYVGPFADALFSMEEGALTGPVRTDFGYHVIQLDEVRGGEAQPFEELRAELQAELARRQAEEEFFDLSETAEDLAFETPDSLQPVADALGLQLQSATGITRAPGEGIAAYPAVLSAAFSDLVLEERENSDVVRADEQTRIVLRVTAHYPPAVRPLAEVSDEIRAMLEQERAEELAAERGEALLARVHAGEALSVVAEELGATYNEPDLYRRTSGLPPALRNELFVASRPADEPVIGSVTLEDGSFAVFVLSEVVPGDTTVLPEADPVATQAGQGHLLAYIAALRADAKVVLIPERLE